MHHFRTASHHPAGHHAATHHAPAHMARARPLVLAAGGAVLRENGNDKTAEACGQYGDACVRCSCYFSSRGEEVSEGRFWTATRASAGDALVIGAVRIGHA